MVKRSISDKETLIEELDKEIDRLLIENEMVLDTELLSTIPGVDKDSAASILAEIGNKMEQFPNEQHLASWAGLSPGNNESAGKKKYQNHSWRQLAKNNYRSMWMGGNPYQRHIPKEQV